MIKSFETKLSLETTPIIKSKEYAVRFNDRTSMTDLISADILWKYLEQILLNNPYEDEELGEINEIFKESVGLNPQLRVYRYKKVIILINIMMILLFVQYLQVEKNGRTKWTLLIYLTGDEEFKGVEQYFILKFVNVHL